MRKGTVGITWRVLALTVVAALLLGVGALLAALGGVGAAEERAAERLDAMVEQINASSASNYNAITDFLNRRESGDDDQFWMLASDGVILYLKDAPTTEAYRGASVGAYAHGGNLQELLGRAGEGEFAHETISVDGREYLVSATAFARNGNVYNLVSFTAVSTFGSSWLGQHSLLVFILAIALVLLVVIPTLIAARLEATRRADRPDAPDPAAPVPAASADSASPCEASACEERQEVRLPDVVGGDSPTDDVESACDDADSVGHENHDGPDVPPPPLLPLRPESELRGHLSELLDSGVRGGCLVRIACRDDDAMERVRRRLGALAGDAKTNCFHWGEHAFLLELFEVNEKTIHDISAYFLQDDAVIVACVPVE